MVERTTDQSVLNKIETLVHEEQHLYGQGQLSDHDQVRLDKIQVELDQCWDLLRQRRARSFCGQGSGCHPRRKVLGGEGPRHRRAPP
jgi:hypothetical protein